MSTAVYQEHLVAACVFVAQRCSLVNGVDCDVTYDVAPVVSAGRARRTCAFLTNVPANRVHHDDSIVCTLAEVQAAPDHAKDRFAGARPPVRLVEGFTRMSDSKCYKTAQLLRSPRRQPAVTIWNFFGV